MPRIRSGTALLALVRSALTFFLTPFAAPTTPPRTPFRLAFVVFAVRFVEPVLGLPDPVVSSVSSFCASVPLRDPVDVGCPVGV
jgi:hypothetical protein